MNWTIYDALLQVFNQTNYTQDILLKEYLSSNSDSLTGVYGRTAVMQLKTLDSVRLARKYSIQGENNANVVYVQERSAHALDHRKRTFGRQRLLTGLQKCLL